MSLRNDLKMFDNLLRVMEAPDNGIPADLNTNERNTLWTLHEGLRIAFAKERKRRPAR